jgi:hypothetical protein
LHNEVHFLALETVSNVHSSEATARFSVEELVARPIQTTNQYGIIAL